MDFNGLFKSWITQREKRLALQISGKDGEPNPGKSDDCRNIHQTGNGARGELRPRHPKEIDQAHEDEPDRDFGQQFGAALEVAREQRKERHEKVEDQNHDSDDTPSSIEPRAVETNFFGQVAGPDDKEL